MRRSGPAIIIEISEILEETDSRIHVMRRRGAKPIWLPKDYVEFLPGAVMVPEWLARKVLAERSDE